jgi:hypothetical protein
MNITPWRLLFIASAVFLLVGGRMHPRGDMASMLADPSWLLSHVLQFASYGLLLIGLVLLGRQPLPELTRRWLRAAVVGAGLMTVEMAVHAAAFVDGPALVAGEATPVLSTHLVLSVGFYPAFAATLIGLIVAGVRDGVLGARWIAPLGIAGLAAHGLAPFVTIVVGMAWGPMLFPVVMLFALWLAMAGLWPVRAESSAPHLASA